MAIKISNNTIIDDSRVIVNASKVGVGTTNPGNTLTVLGDSNITGVTTSNYFDGFFPAGDKVYNENTTVNNGRVNVALESDIIVGSGKTLTVSTGSTIILNPFDFETSSVEELLIDKKLVVGFTSSFDVVTSGVGSVGVTSTRLVGFGTVLPPNIEVGLLVKPIPGIIGAGTTVVSFVAAGSSTGVSTITISPASLNTTVQENITFKFGSYGEKESAIILDGETGVIKSGSNTVIIDGENNKITVGDIDLDGSAGSLSVTANGTERARIDSSGRLLVGVSKARGNLYNNATGQEHRVQIEGTNYLSSGLQIVCNNNSTESGTIVFGKTRGTTVGSNTVVQNGDNLGGLNFQGSDGNELVEAGYILGAVDGTPGANDMPGRLVFGTTADGASSPTEALRITSNKYLRMAASTGGIQFNGDTAAANALDDYEEGGWTPTDQSGASLSLTVTGASYTKIGRAVVATASITYPSTVNGNGAKISLPFSAPAGSYGAGIVRYTNVGAIYNLHVDENQSRITFYDSSGNAVANSALSTKRIDFTAVYFN